MENNFIDRRSIVRSLARIVDISRRGLSGPPVRRHGHMTVMRSVVVTDAVPECPGHHDYWSSMLQGCRRTRGGATPLGRIIIIE